MDDKSVFSVDWLSLTVWCDEKTVRLYIRDFFGAQQEKALEYSGHGGSLFNRLCVGLDGMQLYSEPLREIEGKPYCSFRLPGSSLRAVGLSQVQAFYEALIEENIHVTCTRMDTAFDTQTFTVGDFREAHFNMEVQTKSKNFKEFVTYAAEKITGHTLYFGSRQSETMLRVYLKTDGDSFGEGVPFTRVELELKGKRGAFAFVELMAWDMAHWAVTAGQWLTAFVDVAQDWWARFVEGFVSCWMAIKRKSSTMNKKRAWLLEQVSKTLATVVIADGGGDVDEMFVEFRKLVAEGWGKMSRREKDFVKFWTEGDEYIWLCEVASSVEF